jgi:hypothetical protein
VHHELASEDKAYGNRALARYGAPYGFPARYISCDSHSRTRRITLARGSISSCADLIDPVHQGSGARKLDNPGLRHANLHRLATAQSGVGGLVISGATAFLPNG